MNESRTLLSSVVAGFGVLCVCVMLLSPPLHAAEHSSEETGGAPAAAVTGDCASCSIDAGATPSALWVATYTRPGCTGIAIPMPWHAALAACLLGIVDSIKLFPFFGPCVNCP